MENILISGGSGFIGSNLALKLVSLGYRVNVLDNLSSQVHTNSIENSHTFQSIKDKVNFIRGDVRNRKDWQKAISNSTIIIHLASETGTGQSMYQIEKYVQVNCGGTALMLDILSNEKHSVKKVVVASSRAIYGEGKYYSKKFGFIYPTARDNIQMAKGQFEPLCCITKVPLSMLSTDEDSKIHPSSIYGITKSTQEQMVHVVCKSLGISSIALRYQNVYGPGQSLSNPYTGILSVFSTRILNNNHIEIFEDGKQSRDFVFIDDVVEATVLAIKDDSIKSCSLNIGTGDSTSVLKIGKLLKKLFNSEVNINISKQYRIGDIRHNKADIKKARELIGFKPKVSFEFGIKKFVEWVNSQEICFDNYDKSINEMKNKGLMK